MIEDKERRAFLVKLLGIPAALMALEQGEFAHSKKSRLLLNDDQMTSYEEHLELRWENFHLGGTKRNAPGIVRWIDDVTAFTKETRGTPWHTRSIAVLCMSYQLQGDIFGDKTHYREADKAYSQALRIAQEMNDPELMAAALLRKGIILIGQEKLPVAIQTLNGALETIKGRGLPILKGNLLQVIADTYARLKQPDACKYTTGLAEGVLQQQKQGEQHERTHRIFNAASLTAHKGINALLLGDYERAVALIDKSLGDYDPILIPRRARLLVKKAEAYYGMKEVDACTNVAEEAWKLAYQVGATRAILRIHGIHAKLASSRWSNDTRVRRLGALLATK